jgi:hypothetical protein
LFFLPLSTAFIIAFARFHSTPSKLVVAARSMQVNRKHQYQLGTTNRKEQNFPNKAATNPFSNCKLHDECLPS